MNDWAVQRYPTELTAELRDLPKAEVMEIVEDMRPRLVKICADADRGGSFGPLSSKLGTPADFPVVRQRDQAPRRGSVRRAGTGGRVRGLPR